MPRTRSFRRQVFLALLAVALVPTIAALAGGTLLLREIGSSTGTLGPWTAVASSGRELIDAARAAAPDDSAVAGAADRHGEALSSSVRQSQLYTLVTERVVELLPLVALLVALLLGALAAWTAGLLSRSFAGPIRELVGWTERIARGEPLPDGATSSGAAEFDRLRRSLRAMADALEAARAREIEGARLRAWTEMARRVAHELKNPLTPMRMSAAALARSDDRSTRDTADLLLQEIARLDEIARTFAQFGRLPEGPAAAVDLAELARSVAARHHGKPTPVRVSVDAATPMVVGHHDMLARALGNLVVNAQEAVVEVMAGDGPSGPRGVEIRVAPCAVGASISVLDDGPGIPTHLLATLWDPEVTTKRRGTGLGLALVRQAVEAHGGTVSVENRDEGGSRFTIQLPLEPQEP